MLSYFGRKGINTIKSCKVNNFNSGIKSSFQPKFHSQRREQLYQIRNNGESTVNQWLSCKYENTIVKTQSAVNKLDDSINYCTQSQGVNPTIFNQPMTSVIYDRANFGEFEGSKFKFNIDSIVYLDYGHDSICGDSDRNKTNFILKKLNSDRNLFAKRERIKQESFQCSFNFCAIASTQKGGSNSFQRISNSSIPQSPHQESFTEVEQNGNSQNQQQTDFKHNNLQANNFSREICNNYNSSISKKLPFNTNKILNFKGMSSEAILLIPHAEQQQITDQINMIKQIENKNPEYYAESHNITNQSEQKFDSTRTGSFTAVDADQEQLQYQEVKKIVNQFTQLEIVQQISKSATNFKENIEPTTSKNQKDNVQEDQFIEKQSSISSTLTKITHGDSYCTSSDNNLPSSPQKLSESSLLTSNESSEQSTSTGNKNKSPLKKYDTASDSIHSESEIGSSAKRNNEKGNNPIVRGKQRSNTYKIEKKIGDGCSSVVYLAKELDDGNNILSNNLIAVKKFKKRKEQHFESEQKILSIIKGQHPNIVKIQSINIPQMEIQSEYYSQGDLLDFVIKRGALKESQARFFFKGIANALLYLKSLNICHRDLKLENVLLDSNFNPVIIDFAFASFNKPNFTEFIGTDGYQSPEILMKQPYCGFTSDIFSLGVMLFEMIMGKPPFQSAKLDQGLYKKFISTNDEYWEVFQKYQNPSEEVRDLINKLLEKDPSQRLSIEEVFQHPWLNESNPVEQIEQ